MTDTATTESVSLTRGSLVLVTLSEDYVTSGDRSNNMFGKDRTYYATAARDYGSGWVCLVVPTDDERSRGMWTFAPETYGLSEVLTDGKEYRGWNVQSRYVSLVDSEPFTYLGHRVELDKDKRAALPLEEAYPVGSVWNHRSYGDMPFTVTGHRGAGEVVMSGEDHTHNPWVRGALDSFGTFVGWVDETPAAPVRVALSTTGERLSTGSPVTVGERLAYADQPGAGDSLCRAVPGDLCTVQHVEEGGDLIRVTFDDGHESLRSRYRFRRVTSEGSQEATGSPVTADETTGGTFTQEDIDRAVRDALAEERRKTEAWKEHANDVAIQYAIDNSLCGEFERCMEEIGFRGRNNDYTVTFSVTVSTRNEDAAREEAASILYNDSLSDLHYRISDVEED